nr:reverse transcriptase domain-containing protein [Tanacetum cinerariifolium]
MHAELLAEERAANINTQPFQYSVVPQPPQEEISVEFFQEKINQINSMQTFLRKFNRISFYEMPKVLSLAWETILEIKHALEDKHCQPEDILELFRRLLNDVQNIHEELAVYINTLSWDRPTICYNDDDDEDCTIAITPILSTEEPNNSLSIGDEHLDIILKMESDELIKSSVENLVLIPNQFEDFFDSNEDSTSIDDDSFSIDDIEYVEASPPDSKLVSLEVMEIVIPEVGGIDEDILLTIKDDILREKLLNIKLLIANIEALKENPTPYSDFMTKSSSTSLNFVLEETNTFDNSLPESKTFFFDSKENSSGSTTTRSDISLSDYEAFYDDHVKEISSGSTTTHSDFSLYDSFIFDLSINPFPPADRSNFYHEEFTDELAHIISPPKIDKLADQISTLVDIVSKKVVTPTTVKAVKKSCVTCGGTMLIIIVMVPIAINRVFVWQRGPSIHTNLKKVVEREIEETTDKEQTNFQGSTTHIQPPVAPIPEPDVPKTLPKPNIQYPSRLNDQKLHEKATNQMEKFFKIFQDLHFDISFMDALLLMPKFASTIKSLLANKDNSFELAKISLNENCSAMLLKKFLEKLGDSEKFLITCDFPGMDVCHALADLGASINLMPLFIWKNLSLPEINPTRMTLELADRTITRHKGVAKDVVVKVGKFHFPTDFVVVDFETNPRVPLILGRSFLRTGRALIDVYREEITLQVNDEAITFNLNQTMRYSSTYDDISVNQLMSLMLLERKGSDFILEEIEAYLKDESVSPEIDHADCDLEGDICLIEKLLNDDLFQLPPMDLKQGEVAKAKSLIEEPP